MENDSELLNAARGKDKAALEKIFEVYSSALNKYALRWGCDPILADQIVGDVFVKLMGATGFGERPGNEPAFLPLSNDLSPNY